MTEWLSYPALIWERSNEGPYWDISPFRSLMQPCCGEEHVVDEMVDPKHCSLSYQAVSILTCCLLREICKMGNNPNNNTFMIVAVAIPEGPYLPLSISAVHACSYAIILVPVDPDDASSRLKHMLQQVQPQIILTASECDTIRLQDILMTPCSIDEKLPIQRSQIWNVRSILENEMCSFRPSKTLPTRTSSTPFVWKEWIHSVERTLYDDARVVGETWSSNNNNRISHIVFTSGTTGIPKGCVSSQQALQNYVQAKNASHEIIQQKSRVLLASAISFDPCVGDIISTWNAQAILVVATRRQLIENLRYVLQELQITHCLCTPTLWSTLVDCSSRRNDFQSLQVVALGGEAIPKTIIRHFARSSSCHSSDSSTGMRLFATYGVTEACIYQTMGEVMIPDASSIQGGVSVGQDVGLPFPGMNIRICDYEEASSSIRSFPQLRDVAVGSPGEVVLYGTQLDDLAGYWKQPSPSFVRHEGVVYYRTGDRGYVHPTTHRLHILGRIHGQEGMLKVNGVRVELGELEAALLDDDEALSPAVVVDSVVVVAPTKNDGDICTVSDLIAYVVLSKECLKQMSTLESVPSIPETGGLCPAGPLLALLRERCKTKARITPATYIVLPRIPLSPTGKRNRSGVPPISETVLLESILKNDHAGTTVALRDYGRLGRILALEIIDCLNLQPAQEAILTTSATFAMLGGDSLGATRIVRALFAKHQGIPDTRFLGGAYGTLEGTFSVTHLIHAKDLGAYVDWLEQSGVCQSLPSADDVGPDSIAGTGAKTYSPIDPGGVPGLHLYDALLQAATLGYTNIGISLLDVGADPNVGSHSSRLSRTSGRKDRKVSFRSSPLHISCARGDSLFVRKLLKRKAKFNIPDASALFPVHLVAVGDSRLSNASLDEDYRIVCMKDLFGGGCSLSMKDGNQQTLLHAAARAGRARLLGFILQKWTEEWIAEDPEKRKGSLDWRDSWGRTPVHWAVLNGHVDALKVLMEFGCNPSPLKPSKVNSSVAIESPTETCVRVHGSTELGKTIMSLLQRPKEGLTIFGDGLRHVQER